MSHLVTVRTMLTDPIAVAAACRRLGLAEPVHGTAKLYSGVATGLLVQLPEWQYPVVIDTTHGTVAYDNFEGNWGDESRLQTFMQMYAVEKTRIEANRRGHLVTEHPLEDGSIKLQILEGT